MRKTAHNDKKRFCAPVLCNSKRFGRYKKEEKGIIRETELKETAGMKCIRAAWARMGTELATATEVNYTKALSLLSGIRYGPADIERFCFIISSFTKEPEFETKAGIFLSALVNSRKIRECTLHLEHLERLNGLGYRNRGRIVVEGDSGFWWGTDMECGHLDIHGDAHGWLGFGMKGGRISLHGDAFHRVGDKMEGGRIVLLGNAHNYVGMEMERGSILVKGDAAGLCVGAFMKGGKIVIMGDSRSSLGPHMIGGEIHVMGDMERDDPHRIFGGSNIAGIVHGKIYHKGKLIVNK